MGSWDTLARLPSPQSFRDGIMTTAQALELLGSESVFWMRMSPRSATVARKGDGLQSHTARVKRHAGESFEEMLVRLAEVLVAAPTDFERSRAMRAEKAERDGRREERIECEALKIVRDLKATLQSMEASE